uniref:Uncharacterized protein n=1 Tax=Salix viminalis TaxID=40686 RepID=A0A6N2KA24_SALVM
MGGATFVQSFEDIIDQIDSISINIHNLKRSWVKTYIKPSNSRSAQNSVSSGCLLLQGTTMNDRDDTCRRL